MCMYLPNLEYHNEISIKVSKQGKAETGVLTAVLEGEKLKSQSTKLSAE